MKIRLGYACISDTLGMTTSSTYTYSSFCKENDFFKLDRIIQSNFFALENILLYNKKNNIHFYRLSSGLIPLATKKEVKFEYIKKYKLWYQKLSEIINEENMRVDFHPSEYCVLNSVRSEVVSSSIEILEYHYNLLENLNIKDKVLVVHVGSLEFGKNNAIARFCNTFLKLRKEIQNVLVIENDDKVFNIDDCIEIYKRIGVPIVFDYHHHVCNPGELKLEDALKYVLASWKDRVPKMHFSSPKSKLKKEIRSHHEYINSIEFIKFIEILKKFDFDVDVMIEAKRKDEAMFRLIRELKYRKDYLFVDETTFIV